MDVKEAIEKRRSIRHYKKDPVPEEMIRELLEAARLAPSGTNHQPWRFAVVTEETTKAGIRAAGFDQKYLTQAPVILVCCADVTVYGRDTRARVEELADAGALSAERMKDYPGYATPLTPEQAAGYREHAKFNVALAMENIALRAVSLGLGTCIVQHMRPRKVAELLGLPETLVVCALMPVGYPDEAPAPRPRVSLSEIRL